MFCSVDISWPVALFNCSASSMVMGFGVVASLRCKFFFEVVPVSFSKVDYWGVGYMLLWY